MTGCNIDVHAAPSICYFSFSTMHDGVYYLVCNHQLHTMFHDASWILWVHCIIILIIHSDSTTNWQTHCWTTQWVTSDFSLRLYSHASCTLSYSTILLWAKCYCHHVKMLLLSILLINLKASRWQVIPQKFNDELMKKDLARHRNVFLHVQISSTESLWSENPHRETK